MPSLNTIADLMEKQINATLQSEIKVDKVVLVGGFGDSPALKDFIGNALLRISDEKKTNLNLIVTPPNTGASGVAIGALKRAKNKEHGPAKIPCLSIGIYHHVRYEPESYSEEVLTQTDEWEQNDLDGDLYIMHTIKWIFKAVRHPEFC